MNERILWARIQAIPGVTGDRLEGCNARGVPDAVIKVAHETLFNRNQCFTAFCELKDWSGKRRHPLSMEQVLFLHEYGGIVVIAVPGNKVSILSGTWDLKPLLKGDLDFALTEGRIKLTRALTANDLYFYKGNFNGR